MGIRILLAAALIVFGSSCFADDTSRHVATEELMRYMEAHKAFEDARRMFRSQFILMRLAEEESAEKKAIEQKELNEFFDEVDKKVLWDTVKPAYAAIFEEVYTESEIKGIVAFYNSPAGKAFRDKYSSLSLRLIQTGQQVYGDVIMKHLKSKGVQIDENVPPPPPPPRPPGS